jgi:hypothetical protein
MWMRAFNVRLTGSSRATARMCLPNHNAQFAVALIDGNAPSHRVFVDDTDQGLALRQSAGREPFGQHGDR